VFVPNGADRLVTIPTILNFNADNITFGLGSVTETIGVTMDANGYIPVKKGDVFLIECPLIMFEGTATNGTAWAKYYNSDKSQLLGYTDMDLYYRGTKSVRSQSPIVTAISQDGYMLIGYYFVDKASLSNFSVLPDPYRSRLIVVRMSSYVPHIIANKGALVSSSDPDKISFDETGVMSINSSPTRAFNNTEFVTLSRAASAPTVTYTTRSVYMRRSGNIQIVRVSIQGNVSGGSGQYVINFSGEVLDALPGSPGNAALRPLIAYIGSKSVSGYMLGKQLKFIDNATGNVLTANADGNFYLDLETMYIIA
jgi:hypothetical protein